MLIPPRGVKSPDDLDVSWIHKLDEVLHDDVHAVLMEGPMIAEAEEVELEALALDHAYIGEKLETMFMVVSLKMAMVIITVIKQILPLMAKLEPMA